VARQSKHVRGEGEELDRFIDRCCAALTIAFGAASADRPDRDPDASYACAVRSVLRLLAVFLAAARIPPGRSPARSIRSAAKTIHLAAVGGDGKSDSSFEKSCRAARDSSGLGIFEPDLGLVPRASFAQTAHALLHPPDNSTIDPLFFQTMPVWWLGCAYQAMLALRPAGEPGVLRADRSRRKGRGIFFTPPCLVDYIIKSVLGSIADDRLARLDNSPDGPPDLTVLDPAMGGGDFLGAAVEFISEREPDQRAAVAAHCVYGVDIDPTAVEIARFAVWAASGFADGISDSLCSHLICADMLTDPLPLPSPILTLPPILSLSKGPSPNTRHPPSTPSSATRHTSPRRTAWRGRTGAANPTRIFCSWGRW